ncbi:MAG: EAL domain-containing protein [Pseudorhodoplanes sp.]|uniref:EAL domain-containing protein n=1 Tax=Pseudorhodoplanes sp. TaxID=1934341 RepID=UPI003D11DC2D
MARLTAIFIAICVILIAASIGAIGYLVFRLSGTESAVIALAVMTALALYNTVSARLRDRDDLGEKIADLSRGTADLARQVGEIGRKVSALETQEAARRSRMPNDALAAEIGELGALVKELAEAVAAQDTRFEQFRQTPVIAAPATSRPAPPPLAEARSVARAEPAKAKEAEPQPLSDSASDLVATGPLKGKTAEDITATIAGAIEGGRIDLYLQPVVTLPQRKVRYYEAMTRLRTDDGTLILPSDFLVHAEKAGLIAKIDNMQLFRCVQVLRRLLLKNREIGLFCNVSVATLNDADIFRQFFDFLEANRALSSSLMLEFTQSALVNMGPIEQESLAGLIALGYRFSMDHVTDLRIGPRDLSELGVRFVKVPAQLLLSKAGSAADIHAADLSDLLGRHGISLIAERIETEAVVVDLLDYDVRFGQGFLFSPPRPVRADALHGVTSVSAVADRPAAEATLGAAARAAI